jgi:hypothetical protein
MTLSVFKNTHFLLVTLTILTCFCCKSQSEKKITNTEEIKTEYEVKEIILGADQVTEYLPLLKNKKIGIVANQTSVLYLKDVDHYENGIQEKIDLRLHLVDYLHQEKINIKNVFAPEHGAVQEYDYEFEKTLVSLRIRVAADDTPQSFWDTFREGKKESIDELFSIMAFAYRKNYSHNEIKELLDFYSTTAAQKLVKNKDDFTQEELKVIEDFNASKIAETVLEKKETLAVDVKDISYDWSKELFSKGISAIVKAGYTK